MSDRSTYVTMPSLAPLDEYTEILRGVWDRGILTHNGPLVQRLESELSDKLRLPGFVAVSNGTIAIQMAIKALKLRGGEIITTPFTWIATLSAIQWEGCKPVFCDIDPMTFNIDPTCIESCITDETVAIMPVHVFGTPCDVDAIQKIADKYGLKVIYDAAHAVGSTYKGASVLQYGDISATSLHATKLLNTAEGGGCITKDAELFEKLKRIRFFGHNEDKHIVEEGFNGKMTEVHAALGLANLKYFDDVLSDRCIKYDYYLSHLGGIADLQFQRIEHGEANHSYFPVVMPDEKALSSVVELLNQENIFPRRYFYPAVNTYDCVVPYTPCPEAESIADRILCLPLYWTLSMQTCGRICQVVQRALS